MNKKKIFKHLISLFIIAIFFCNCTPYEINRENWNSNIQFVLDSLPPLKYDRNKRLPLYLGMIDQKDADIKSLEYLIKELDKRGIGLFSSWIPDTSDPGNLSQCMNTARIQTKLGLQVNINANSLLDYFFNGDIQTAHIDDNGTPFFDESFGKKYKMGCPFSIDFRKKEIQKRVEFYVKKYAEENLKIDFIYADWEIDGPHEFNYAFETSKRCSRCRNFLGDNFTFSEFQKVIREMRSYLQYYAYSSPILKQFPEALVGNYAVYPNDGYRYWYDHFEFYVEGQPYKADQNAKYRKWYNDFPATGYTVAMPVVYTWYPTYNWYDFDNSDYRWFYNMLLVASNAGKNTPREIPIISFVTWNTVWVYFGRLIEPDPNVKQLSEDAYKELLWHMLFRGTKTFKVYIGGKKEFPKEVKMVHEVYSEAQQYGAFLDNGFPITFDVPDKPDVVISGLALGDSVLVRRTDFGTKHEPVEILSGTKIIRVNYKPGECQLLTME